MGDDAPVLAVVGAGPKAVGVAVKHAALRAAGHAVPELVVLDPGGVAGHWDGGLGYTDGEQRLGTPPFKDLGFPYAATWDEASGAVNEHACHASWPTYLATTHRYGDWVDRGALHPTHRQWAAYLRWAAQRVALEPRPVGLAGLGLDGGRWRLHTSDGQHLLADGVLLTGPGPSRTLPGQQPGSARVLDGRTVWSALARLVAEPPRTVAVVGAGETAGAVAAALGRGLPAESVIDVVTADGVLHSRGESHTENALYTDPTGWQALPERARLALLATTDRGVFSQAAQQAIDALDSVRTVPGRAVRVEERADGVALSLDDGSGDGEPVAVIYDVVVVATGFDPLWWLPLDDGTVEPALRRALDGPVTQRALERAVGHDLTVTGLDPPLHVPMLAGLVQGPGFPNLSCLGLLADRVLGRWCGRRVATPTPRAVRGHAAPGTWAAP